MNKGERAEFRDIKGKWGAALLLVVLCTHVFASCADTTREPHRNEIIRALDRSLNWLASHPSDPGSAQIGEQTLDIWPWTIFSRLHPDPEIRAHCASEARRRLKSLEPKGISTLVSLSYWALLLRNIDSQNIDASTYREALSRVNIKSILATGNPTTNLWITELLQYSGIPEKSCVKETYLATNTARGFVNFGPTVKGAYALYHEIAPAADLGLKPIRAFSNDQLAFARRILPELLKVSRTAGDTDAVAEVLITASLLGEQEKHYYSEGIYWLLTQQREDGTYRDTRIRSERPPPVRFRHGILVASWALLESLQ